MHIAHLQTLGRQRQGERGAEVTLKALELGVNDILPRPVDAWSPDTPGDIALAQRVKAHIDAARAAQGPAPLRNSYAVHMPPGDRTARIPMRPRPSMPAKESSMLDIAFFGGGLALFCLLIAYERLCRRL